MCDHSLNEADAVSSLRAEHTDTVAAMRDRSLKSAASRGSLPDECPFVMASYNVGLTTDHVFNSFGPNPYLYTFTWALTRDIALAFRNENVNVLFLCELGSMKEPHKINEMFAMRAEIAGKDCPSDLSECLHDYLEKLLKNAGLGNLQISCVGPYACIWDSQRVEMITELETFRPSPSNTNRIAVASAFMHKPSRLEVNVVCCRSPTSKNWDDLNKGVKKNDFPELCPSCRWAFRQSLCEAMGCLWRPQH